jgi:hypothetical protein
MLIDSVVLGWWVGRVEKWRSPFLGVGWRCGVSVSNTAKANSIPLSLIISQIAIKDLFPKWLIFPIGGKTHCLNINCRVFRQQGFEFLCKTVVV